jgi:hypothetical protein
LYRSTLACGGVGFLLAFLIGSAIVIVFTAIGLYLAFPFVFVAIPAWMIHFCDARAGIPAVPADFVNAVLTVRRAVLVGVAIGIFGSLLTSFKNEESREQ